MEASSIAKGLPLYCNGFYGESFGNRLKRIYPTKTVPRGIWKRSEKPHAITNSLWTAHIGPNLCLYKNGIYLCCVKFMMIGSEIHFALCSKTYNRVYSDGKHSFYSMHLKHRL